MSNDSTIPDGLPVWLAPHADEAAAWGPIDRPAPQCWVGGCERDARLLGLCKAHHRRAQRAWNPRPSEEHYRRVPAQQHSEGRTPDAETAGRNG
ncbi:hypothetical protein [Microbacterium sp. ZXX196]|uniref:hypothetical protein n=1 Tax=Microbacterium sp. ZXX196 TaxID=2609291 RepID=UPI0012B7D375|nr:hypothetical protein [Microbacterium sp. ZXX196]MTE22659.1 hypothetical protein [Microbacterium sp. ZXX196]